MQQDGLVDHDQMEQWLSFTRKVTSLCDCDRLVVKVRRGRNFAARSRFGRAMRLSVVYEKCGGHDKVETLEGMRLKVGSSSTPSGRSAAW